MRSERDNAIWDLDKSRARSKFSPNIVFLESKLSKLEGVHARIPNLEKEIENTRKAVEMTDKLWMSSLEKESPEELAFSNLP